MNFHAKALLGFVAFHAIVTGDGPDQPAPWPLQGYCPAPWPHC
ncbi:hypothetical protein [Limnohabitans sp. Jir72]|nr:hypothetical protein [Limnohabitans sp. Jir72]